MTPTEAMTPAGTLVSFLLTLIVLPIVCGMVFKAPKLVVLGFMAVLFMFSDSTWGELNAKGTIYSRGAGMFYFSLVNLALMASGFALLCKRLAARGSAQLAAPLSKYFLALIYLLLSHVVVGLMLGIELDVILGYHGILNVLNMMVFMFLVIEAFKNEGDQEKLLLAIIALAAVRSLFGLIRYVLFGGDAANPYRNFEQIDMKILFFDISDNFVASLGAFCAAWALTSPEVKLSAFKRLVAFALLALCVAAVALSFRRSALIGLGLMLAFLVYRLPGRQRLIVSVFACGFLFAIAAIFFEQRLQFAASDRPVGGSIFSSLFYDIAPQNGIEENRFYELYAAAQSLGGNWLIGLGTWGSFTGDEELLSYHFGTMDFIHSGFGHIVLKTGLIGLLVFCGLLASYISYYFRQRKTLGGYPLLVADAGFAGFLFWIPTFLIGTPIIEIRTMLLFGFTLAMPFVAARLEGYRLQTHHGLRSQYVAA